MVPINRAINRAHLSGPSNVSKLILTAVPNLHYNCVQLPYVTIIKIMKKYFPNHSQYYYPFISQNDRIQPVGGKRTEAERRQKISKF